MVRISIPTLPHHHPVSSAATPKAAATEQLCSFLARPGRAALLTGAGVSVDSGIRAYRGEDGRYMNPNYQFVFRLPSSLFLFSYLKHQANLSGSYHIHSIYLMLSNRLRHLLVSANDGSYPSRF